MKLNRLTLIAALGAVALSATAANAGSWSRGWTQQGPHGVSSFHGSGSCYAGDCSSKQTWNGPHGGTASRQGSTNCSGGQCNGQATYTGPNGGQVFRQRSFSRW